MTDDNFRALCELTAALAAQAFPVVEDRAEFEEWSVAMFQKLIAVMGHGDAPDEENATALLKIVSHEIVRCAVRDWVRLAFEGFPDRITVECRRSAQEVAL